ncbi:MAG: hypothetical protein LBT33_09830, partial [Spirochaetia bacterium]|nr:hypothetical protein [Spirochaetia bacterium]
VSRFFLSAFFACGKKPGYSLQSILPLRGKKGFPLLSRLHGRATILPCKIVTSPLRPTGWSQPFGLLLAHASRAGRNPSGCCSPMHPGLATRCAR